MKTRLITFAAMLLLGSIPIAQAQEDAALALALFRNVKVFDGAENKLHDVDVLVDGNLIVDEGASQPSALAGTRRS
ncbi:MAG: hypothetical protein GY904_00465 [Planctomycetaceae bacterium]|nr:hypothetical protein [Planctomycetaceae bacterium]